MLSNWQIVLLDNGFWILPLLFVAAMAVFPWKHWNSLIKCDSDEDMLDDEQLEVVIGGMSPQRFSDWRAEKINESR